MEHSPEGAGRARGLGPQPAEGAELRVQIPCVPGRCPQGPVRRRGESRVPRGRSRARWVRSQEQTAQRSSSFQPTACTLLVLQGQVEMRAAWGSQRPQSPEAPLGYE